MNDPLTVTHKLGNICGHPSFEDGLQMYTDALMRIASDLHGRGVEGFRVRVLTGDTIEVSFSNADDATMFRLRWA